jgi:hypothetical protein
MVGVIAFVLKGKGSNFTNGEFVVNNGKLTKYSPMWFFKINAYLG